MWVDVTLPRFSKMFDARVRLINSNSRRILGLRIAFAFKRPCWAWSTSEAQRYSSPLM